MSRRQSEGPRAGTNWARVRCSAHLGTPVREVPNRDAGYVRVLEASGSRSRAARSRRKQPVGIAHGCARSCPRLARAAEAARRVLLQSVAHLDSIIQGE
jgi:hypothetical protein